MPFSLRLTQLDPKIIWLPCSRAYHHYLQTMEPALDCKSRTVTLSNVSYSTIELLHPYLACGKKTFLTLSVSPSRFCRAVLLALSPSRKPQISPASPFCVLNPITGSAGIMGTPPVTVSPQLSPHTAKYNLKEYINPQLDHIFSLA